MTVRGKWTLEIKPISISARLACTEKRKQRSEMYVEDGEAIKAHVVNVAVFVFLLSLCVLRSLAHKLIMSSPAVAGVTYV